MPAPYELELCSGEIVEQIIRPTGLVDPQIQMLSRVGTSIRSVRSGSKTGSPTAKVLGDAYQWLAEDLAVNIEQRGFRGQYLQRD